MQSITLQLIFVNQIMQQLQQFFQSQHSPAATVGNKATLYNFHGRLPYIKGKYLQCTEVDPISPF